MTDQLDLFAPKKTSSEQDENLAQFLAILERSGEWMTATAVLTRMPGWNLDENAKRNLRRLAGLSYLIISGSQGYRHAAHATTEEIHHFVSLMQSQAAKMVARAHEVNKLAHARLG